MSIIIRGKRVKGIKGEKLILIKKIKALSYSELPTKFLTTFPHCYSQDVGCNSDALMIVYGKGRYGESHTLIPGCTYQERYVKKTIRLVKQCGENLTRFNQRTIKERNKDVFQVVI
jgi:hypothetical protein